MSQQAPEVTLEQQIKALLDELREEVYRHSYRGQMDEVRERVTRLRLLSHQLLNSKQEEEQ